MVPERVRVAAALFRVSVLPEPEMMPAKVLFEQFGFTPAQVAATVEGVLAHR